MGGKGLVAQCHRHRDPAPSAPCQPHTYRHERSFRLSMTRVEPDRAGALVPVRSGLTVGRGARGRCRGTARWAATERVAARRGTSRWTSLRRTTFEPCGLSSRDPSMSRRCGRPGRGRLPGQGMQGVEEPVEVVERAEQDVAAVRGVDVLRVSLARYTVAIWLLQHQVRSGRICSSTVPPSAHRHPTCGCLVMERTSCGFFIPPESDRPRVWATPTEGADHVVAHRHR
jgi:hypothetical protein